MHHFISFFALFTLLSLGLVNSRPTTDFNLSSGLQSNTTAAVQIQNRAFGDEDDTALTSTLISLDIKNLGQLSPWVLKVGTGDDEPPRKLVVFDPSTDTVEVYAPDSYSEFSLKEDDWKEWGLQVKEKKRLIVPADQGAHVFMQDYLVEKGFVQDGEDEDKDDPVVWINRVWESLAKDGKLSNLQ